MDDGYDWTSKAHDRKPSIPITLTRGGAVATLTNASFANVIFTAVELDDPDAALPATLVERAGNLDTVGGVARYDKSAAFAARPPGLYKTEVEVTYSDGTRETFPNGGPQPYLLGRIYPDLADGS